MGLETMAKFVSYGQSGVDIDANDVMVDKIQSALSSTYGPRVINLPGGFAGLFRLDYDERLFKKNFKNPVLVACTDGVGSKVQLAAEAKKYDSVGIDLVAMSVNDMLVLGAEPLFFLDYLGIHNLEPNVIAEMVKGVAAGCRLSDCALLGGETAEMPDTYKKGGLASSGIHSNGYALVRNICFKRLGLKMTDKIDELDGQVLGDVLLTPTRIYVRSIIRLLNCYKVKKVIHGMAHITGAGLPGNVPRVIPANRDAALEKGSWPVPKIFKFLQEKGPVEEDEMYRVFNMGIGYTLIVAEDFADSIAEKLESFGEKVYKIGKITAGKGEVVFK